MKWILFLWNYPPEKLIERRGGFDALIYLTFLKENIIIFLILSIIGGALLMPLYAIGTEQTIGDLDIISLANLQQGLFDLQSLNKLIFF